MNFLLYCVGVSIATQEFVFYEKIEGARFFQEKVAGSLFLCEKIEPIQ
jgi:hypothetical protein